MEEDSGVIQIVSMLFILRLQYLELNFGKCHFKETAVRFTENYIYRPGAYLGGVVGCGRPPLLPSGTLLVFLIFLN